MTNKEVIGFLNNMKSEPVDYGELVGAPSPYLGVYYVYTEPEDYAIDLAIKALEQQDKEKWIPVSEGLPEYENAYLCTVYRFEDEYTYTEEMLYYPEEMKWAWTEEPYKMMNYRTHRVTAWKPMPEEYKGE